MKRTKFSWKQTKRKRPRQHHQIIAVDLKDKMKEFETNPPPIPGFKISRMKYLIHLILSHKQKKYTGSYSVLNMQYMTNIIPGADEYLKFLCKQNIIEWINYSAGRNSRLYRMCEEGPTAYQTITDQSLVRRIQKAYSTQKLRNSKKYPNLNRSIKKVKINTDAALRTIEHEYERNMQEGNLHAESRRTYAQAAVFRIAEQDFFIGVNATNYRLDSNITNLPGRLISHLTIDGHKLIEMDISNSQPFFAASLFDPTPDVCRVVTKYLGNSLIMSIKSLDITDCEDVKLYRSLVTTGKFYEHMITLFQKHNIPYVDRKDVKLQMLTIFFGKRYAYKYNPAAALFREEFPNVQRLFDLVKRSEYNRLAILLQRIESYVMIDQAAQNIQREIPSLDILTKHDSILPTRIYLSQECERARQIMVDTIHQKTGLIPQGRMRKFIETDQFFSDEYQ